MRALPLLLTYSRLLAAPLLAAAFFLLPAEGWRNFVCAIIFLLAMLTDFWDGFLARRYNAVTRFGELLDPVADKILVCTALLLLLADNRAPLLAALVIVLRELAVSALREWAMLLLLQNGRAGAGRALPVAAAGRWKTGFQTAAIALLLHQDDILFLPTEKIGLAFLWLAVAVALYSAFAYLQSARALLASLPPPQAQAQAQPAQDEPPKPQA